MISLRSIVKTYAVEIALTIFILVSTLFLIRGFNHRQRVTLSPVPLGKALVQPTQFIPMPGTDRFLVLEKSGTGTWFNKSNTDEFGEFLNIVPKVYSSGHEEGLLSLAFDPRFPEGAYVYVFYNTFDESLKSRISRFKVSQDFRVIEASERVLWEIEKPKESHNGGMLIFGPDDKLYVTVGDSTVTSVLPRSESEELLQSQKSFLGKILRLDVIGYEDAPMPYGIPSDNPFISRPSALPEIWAYGFRNTWRMSWDKSTNRLFGFDVGGGKFEEVNLVEKGQNYGWPIMEGIKCAHSSDHGNCDKSEKVLPIGSYGHHRQLNAITGGHLYRGQDLQLEPETIVFSSFQSGIFCFQIRGSHTNQSPVRLIGPSIKSADGFSQPLTLSSLDQDSDGELIAVDFGGTLYRLKPADMRTQFISAVNAVWDF